MENNTVECGRVVQYSTMQEFLSLPRPQIKIIQV